MNNFLEVPRRRNPDRKPRYSAMLTFLAVLSFAFAASACQASAEESTELSRVEDTSAIVGQVMDDSLAIATRASAIETAVSDLEDQRRIESELPSGYPDSIFKVELAPGGPVCTATLAELGYFSAIKMDGTNSLFVYGTLVTNTHCLSKENVIDVQPGTVFDLTSVRELQNGDHSRSVTVAGWETLKDNKGNDTGVGVVTFFSEATNLVGVSWQGVGPHAFADGSQMIPGEKSILVGFPDHSGGKPVYSEAGVVGYLPSDKRLVIDSAQLLFGFSGGPVLDPESDLIIGVTDGIVDGHPSLGVAIPVSQSFVSQIRLDATKLASVEEWLALQGWMVQK